MGVTFFPISFWGFSFLHRLWPCSCGSIAFFLYPVVPVEASTPREREYTHRDIYIPVYRASLRTSKTLHGSQQVIHVRRGGIMTMRCLWLFYYAMTLYVQLGLDTCLFGEHAMLSPCAT
ncbi:uncharacterized protein B0I36DRAFT_5914 [Microdochium trichocladiopsis]|uniref:Uncharacterized protein n=1 Tax=Microdochium trichocladiopsis TaxID=1682393 RepID=A0A9P8YGJ3_9PEZI|nr:uncharacterized protein B0I36DRAFT_5914 [Microdochium trichocladiopsis]KAH7040116.1 hypothetical protein B0I36DRAFT_5914 [Microdochium trichocladiopsis]